LAKWLSDLALSTKRVLKRAAALFSEILGKPIRNDCIDLFLAEAIKPIYLHRGFSAIVQLWAAEVLPGG